MTRAAAVFCAILALTAAFGQRGSAVTRSEGTEGAERIITLENEHLRLVIFPDLGGRIGHIIDRATGDDLVYWDLTPDSVYGGLGGALDDRRNTFAQYRVTLPEDSPGSVALSYADEEAGIDKTITLEDGASTIRVEYTFSNPSQQDFDDYEAMVKNFLLPSGGPVSEADLYCIPTTAGVREITARTGSWNYPDLAGKFKRDVGPWNAIVSTEKHRALTAALSNDLYRWFYMWKGGIDYPTYEWVFQPLPAGTRASVTLWLHVASGLDAVSHADDAVVVDTRPADDGLATSVFAAREVIDGGTLETTVRLLPDGDEVALDAVDLPDTSRAETATVTIPWQPEDGTWVISQRIVSGGELLSRWEKPVTIGEPTAEYSREIAFPAQAQIEPIPGWERIEEQDFVQPSDAELRRGFVVYLDEFAPEGERGLPLRRYEMDLGQGEQKTFGMRIRALQDLQNLQITTESEDFPVEQIEVFAVEEVDVSNESAGKSDLIGRKLIPWHSADLSAGREAEAWVRVTTTPAQAGELRAELSVRARDTGRSMIELLLDVRPVALPRPNLVSQEAEHQLMGLPGCWDAEAGAWNEEVLEAYASDLGDHLVDFEQGFWGWFRYSRQPDQVLLEDGRTLAQWKASEPTEDERPRVDFSYLNPVFDAAIRHGLVRFSTNSSGSLPPEHVPGVVMSEAARYLRDRGYPAADIWCKHMDEQPSTNFPRMADEVQWLRDHGWRPFSTFHNVLANPGQMEILSPEFDMFQGGFPSREDVRARLEDGTLEPDDEVWMYQGWGATWRTYTDNRRPGWFAAAANLDGYHVHVYYRWSMTDAVIFPSEEGPASSPAWEAMRDGMTDAQWVALARAWIERLERASETDRRLTTVVASARERLAAAVGDEGGVISLTRTRDRLHWVERLAPETFSVPEAERAREIVLDLLTDLRRHVALVGSSLHYGGHTLAEDGEVFVRIASGDAPAVGLTRRLLEEQFGVTPRMGPGWAGEFAIDLRTGDLSGWENADLHIWNGYPAAGEYVIHVEPPAGAGPTRMLIYAPDEAGLAKGILNWARFLRAERP